MWFPSAASASTALRRRRCTVRPRLCCALRLRMWFVTPRCVRVLLEAIQVCTRLRDALRLRKTAVVSRSRRHATFRPHETVWTRLCVTLRSRRHRRFWSRLIGAFRPWLWCISGNVPSVWFLSQLLVVVSFCGGEVSTSVQSGLCFPFDGVVALSRQSGCIGIRLIG